MVVAAVACHGIACAPDDPPGAPGSASSPTSQALREGLHDAAADFWIYDDVDSGFATAERLGKPLLVSIRCVP